MTTCTECNQPFTPTQTSNRAHPQTTCGTAACQRARKTRLQCERRHAGTSTTTRDPLPHRSIYNHEAPTLNRYSVIRSERRTGTTHETVEAKDLTWAEATKCSETLQKAETAAHPERTSWTADLFYRQLQPPTTPTNAS